MTDVLCLASNFTPLCRMDWKDAMSRVIKGRVEVLEEYNDVLINGEIPLPAVIRYKSMAKMVFSRGVRFNRKNVWLRDGGHCCYCGKTVTLDDFTYDHVVPRSQGGTTCWENIVVACRACNLKKENKTPTQARMALLSKPIRPKSLPGQIAPSFVLGKGDHIPDSWKDYLGSYRYWCQPLAA